MFILQLLSFLSILALLILEGGRAYRAYNYSKKPFKYRSQILKGIGVAFSTAITLAIVGQWTFLSTTKYNEIPDNYNTNEKTGLTDYLNTLKEFYSIYTFLTYYRLLISLNVIMFIGRLLSLLSYYDAFAAINAAVDVAFWPLATVLTYLALVLLASAVIGTINFGPDSSSFSFWTTSFVSLFRFICMADFDYSGISATQVNKPLFLLFYCGFILYGYFVIINIFSAIIFDSFDSTKMYRISLRGHGSQFRRTFNIITRCMWPGKVIQRLNSEKDVVYTWEQLLEKYDSNENEVINILTIYGEYPDSPPQEQEHEE